MTARELIESKTGKGTFIPAVIAETLTYADIRDLMEDYGEQAWEAARETKINNNDWHASIGVKYKSFEQWKEEQK